MIDLNLCVNRRNKRNKKQEKKIDTLGIPNSRDFNYE